VYPVASADPFPTTADKIIINRLCWAVFPFIYRITHQKEHGFRFFGEKARPEGLFVANAPEELVLVAAVKRRLADHHFVEQDAKRPPIYALVVL